MWFSVANSLLSFRFHVFQSTATVSERSPSFLTRLASFCFLLNPSLILLNMKSVRNYSFYLYGSLNFYNYSRTVRGKSKKVTRCLYVWIAQTVPSPYHRVADSSCLHFGGHIVGNEKRREFGSFVTFSFNTSQKVIKILSLSRNPTAAVGTDGEES